MAFRWACNRCGQLHGGNPARCISCRHTVLTPVSRATVEEHGIEEPKTDYWTPEDEPDGSDVTTPTAIDPGEITTYRGTPDVEYESSPDVALDGSIAGPETPAPGPESGVSNRRKGYSPFVIITAVVLLMFVLLFLLTYM